MAEVPEKVARFLAAERIAVVGVSRDPRQPANAILRRLRETGHSIVAINPNATELEGERCHPSLSAVPDRVDAVMIATHPNVSIDVVREAVAAGIEQIWFHRSFGEGSVSAEAVAACEEAGIDPIVGGCPLMYAGKVDIGHRCMRWWLSRSGRVPV